MQQIDQVFRGKIASCSRGIGTAAHTTQTAVIDRDSRLETGKHIDQSSASGVMEVESQFIQITMPCHPRYHIDNLIGSGGTDGITQRDLIYTH